MDASFLGFDHVDARVRSLARVETFYDALLPSLGLVDRTTSFVDADGLWHPSGPDERYNVVEYTEPPMPGHPSRFLGIIEDAGMEPVRTRIAFAVASKRAVLEWVPRLEALGACNIELDDDMDGYPAVFFEDAVGTRLELCARRVRPSA